MGRVHGGPGPRGPRAIEAPAHWEGPPTATYPGFQVFEDGTSRVFIEIAGGSVTVKEMHHEGVFRYRFEGVRVPERVNRLPLPTVHFETPVSLVEIAQIGSDADLIIHMRHRSQPNARLERSHLGHRAQRGFSLRRERRAPLGGPVGGPAERGGSCSRPRRRLRHHPRRPRSTTPTSSPPGAERSRRARAGALLGRLCPYPRGRAMYYGLAP
jgi:hypothetical protein